MLSRFARDFFICAHQNNRMRGVACSVSFVSPNKYPYSSYQEPDGKKQSNRHHGYRGEYRQSIQD